MDNEASKLSTATVDQPSLSLSGVKVIDLIVLTTSEVRTLVPCHSSVRSLFDFVIKISPV